MKSKILIIGIILLLISCTFIGTSKITNIESSNKLEKNDINIAILTKERAWESRDIEFFMEMLVDYSWIVGNKQYILNIEELDDNDILDGKLTIENFDAFVVPGGSVGDAEAFVRWIPGVKNYKWKKAVDDFVKDGGGYFSVCGGTMLLTTLNYEPRSFVEHAYDKTVFDSTCIKMHYNGIGLPFFLGFPFICKLSGIPTEYQGALTYGLWTGWDISNFTVDHRGGLCLDFQVNTSHPIFDDYLKNTRLIRWIGGPALVVPENPDREVSVLASYPEEEISDFSPFYTWEYKGGIKGFMKGFVKYLQKTGDAEFTSSLLDIFALAEDWDKTDVKIETEFSNSPAITAEIYPNDHEARVVLSAPHTERNVWWGGEYRAVEDTDHNNLFDGFYRLYNITKNPFDLEWTYNQWINRRCITWTAKIADNNLPPVYGPSQVCDFDQDTASSEFTVYGNSERAGGIVTLDLYYRYSVDGTGWTEYTLYDTDDDESDGWSWEFNSPNGSGYYEFYSIRAVEYEGYIETENIPPGADSIVFIEAE